MTRRVIEGCYARLCGIKDTATWDKSFLPRSFASDYEHILGQLRMGVDDFFEGFDLGDDVFRPESAPAGYEINVLPFFLKLIS
jgi:hypothetical protein